MLVARCDAPERRYTFSIRGNALEQHRPADDRTFNGPTVLEVFTKPPDERIEDAIWRRFVEPLGHDARKGCRVVRLRRSPLERGKVALTVVPVGAYARRIAREQRRGPRDFGCGVRGRQQALTYFEYHPGESRTTFAWVVYGWESEKPLFDERSIQFLR